MPSGGRGGGKVVHITSPSKKIALRFGQKRLNSQSVEMWFAQWSCLLFPWYILLLLLEESPGEEGTLGAAAALPRGQGNWKCGRTSCSWETFCLLVCALEIWLPPSSPRPLDFGKASSLFLSSSLCSSGSSRGFVLCVLWRWRLLGGPRQRACSWTLGKWHKQQRKISKHLTWKHKLWLEQEYYKTSFLILAKTMSEDQVSGLHGDY